MIEQKCEGERRVGYRRNVKERSWSKTTKEIVNIEAIGE